MPLFPIAARSRAQVIRHPPSNPDTKTQHNPNGAHHDGSSPTSTAAPVPAQQSHQDRENTPIEKHQRRPGHAVIQACRRPLTFEAEVEHHRQHDGQHSRACRRGQETLGYFVG
ncbi:MAG: hypothetical protein Q9193_005066 [Seirophora villosa]